MSTNRSAVQATVSLNAFQCSKNQKKKRIALLKARPLCLGFRSPRDKFSGLSAVSPRGEVLVAGVWPVGEEGGRYFSKLRVNLKTWKDSMKSRPFGLHG